ncbi:helix-turn-helix domain-containing protein [Rathayibacter sp. Leaf299]|uniref:helix-turn-helix domain-containing protein n=1 Tax=Rathayibacter sp. Leaf299 TaxID=1736328 RepID=UPI0009EBB153|nr:DUF2690 domain-containing protein [Rathayibacter sp. Leaf299]
MSEEDPQQRPLSLAELTKDLRRLRMEAGDPTLVQLANRTNLSKSTIAEAFRGKQLPSERTLVSLVRALGEDPSPWLNRRADLATVSSAVEPDAELSNAARGPRRMVSLRAAAALAVVAFGAGIAVTTGFIILTPQAADEVAATPSADASSVAIRTGVDPAATSCVDDAEPAAAETRSESYLLEVMWSESCQAAWGRVTRYDNQSSNNAVHVEIAPQGTDSDGQRQEATVSDVQGAYTALIVRTDGDTRLCARGSVTLETQTIDLGDPLCT